MYDAMHTPDDVKARDPFYDWVERVDGWRYYVGGVTSPATGVSASLTLQRPRAAGHAEREDIARFVTLFAHYERAMQTALRLAADGAIGPGWREAVEASPLGIVFIAADGRVVLANDAARRIAGAADGFALSPLGVAALRASDQAVLETLIAQALAVARDPRARPGGMMRLARRSGRTPLHVTVAPLPRARGMFEPLAPAAVVFVSDPDSATGTIEDRLRGLYGLTPAEARLATRLAAGVTLEAAADALSIASPTARTQLAGVFRKTGTRRQSELVRLLLLSPWQLGAR
jgi:DNA-binding CsgD family transcriptional regulator